MQWKGRMVSRCKHEGKKKADTRQTYCKYLAVLLSKPLTMEERADSPDCNVSPRHRRLCANAGFLKYASIMAGFSHEDSMVVWLYLEQQYKTRGVLSGGCFDTSGEQGARGAWNAKCTLFRCIHS